MEVFPPDDPQSNEVGNKPTVSQLEQINSWDDSFANLEKVLQAACEKSNDSHKDLNNCSRESTVSSVAESENPINKTEIKRKWETEIVDTVESNTQKLKRMNSMLLNSGEVTIQLVNSPSENCDNIPISSLLTSIKTDTKPKYEDFAFEIPTEKMLNENKDTIQFIKLEPKAEIKEEKTDIKDEKKPSIFPELEKNSCITEESSFSTDIKMIVSREIKNDSGFTDDLSTESKNEFYPQSDDPLSYNLKEESSEFKTNIESKCPLLAEVSSDISDKISTTSSPVTKDSEELLTSNKNENIEQAIEEKKEEKDKKDETADRNIKKEDKLSKKKKFERCNIRDIKLEEELDAVTLSAQKEEQERIRRLQEAQMRALQERLHQIEVEKEALSQLFSQSTDDTPSLFDSTLSETEVPAEKKVTVKTENDVVLVESDEDKKAKLQSVISSTIATPIEENIIDISSSSSGNESDSEDSDKKDDDIMVLSDGEETTGETAEDPNNSGAHTNDCFNLPDEEGRVLVNVGHPPEDPDIFLAPQIAKVIKPHQIGGIRFLYDNVVENLERYKSSSGFGCILAHSMGLGKTVQVVSFVDVFLRHTPATLVLCIVPINTIQNWKAEFDMWVPPLNCVDDTLVLSGEVRPRDYNIYTLNENFKTMAARASLIAEWQKNGGVLLMGYEMYRMLALRKMPKIPIKKSKRIKKHELNVEPETNEQIKKYMEEMYEHIVIPGPDLVICDEGHRIKNSLASTSMALKSIKTRRRVVLTGYPLQNNLLEYWCMVDFVRPNYLGSRAEFCNMFERPISNGQCIDSTPRDRQLMRFRSHVLHSLLVGFVQRRGHSVLRAVLPKKEEHVLLIRMTPIQRQLYKCFVKDLLYVQQATNPLKLFAVCCKIWNHPDILYKLLQEKKAQEDIDLDIDITMAANSGVPGTNMKKRVYQAKSKGVQRSLKALPRNIKSEHLIPSIDEVIKQERGGCEQGNIQQVNDLKFDSHDIKKEDYGVSNQSISSQSDYSQQGSQSFPNTYGLKNTLNSQFCQSNYDASSGMPYPVNNQNPYSSKNNMLPSQQQFTSQASSQSTSQNVYSQSSVMETQYGQQSQNQFSLGNTQHFTQVESQIQSPYSMRSNQEAPANHPQSPQTNYQAKSQTFSSQPNNCSSYSQQADLLKQMQTSNQECISNQSSSNQETPFPESPLSSNQKFVQPPQQYSQNSQQTYNNSQTSQQYSQQQNFNQASRSQFQDQQSSQFSQQAIGNQSQTTFSQGSNQSSPISEQSSVHHYSSQSPFQHSPTQSQFSQNSSSQQSPPLTHQQFTHQTSYSQMSQQYDQQQPSHVSSSQQSSPSQSQFPQASSNQTYSQQYSQQSSEFTQQSAHQQFQQQNVQTFSDQQSAQSQFHSSQQPYSESNQPYTQQSSPQQQFSQQTFSQPYLQSGQQYPQQTSQENVTSNFGTSHQFSHQVSKFSNKQAQQSNFSQPPQSSGENIQYSQPSQSAGQKQSCNSPPDKGNKQKKFNQQAYTEQPSDSQYSQIGQSTGFSQQLSQSNSQSFTEQISNITSQYTVQQTASLQFSSQISNTGQYSPQANKPGESYNSQFPQQGDQLSDQFTSSSQQYNQQTPQYPQQPLQNNQQFSKQSGNTQQYDSNVQMFSQQAQPTQFTQQNTQPQKAYSQQMPQNSQTCSQQSGQNVSKYNQQVSTTFSQQQTQLSQQFGQLPPSQQYSQTSQSPQHFLQQPAQNSQQYNQSSGPGQSSQLFSQQSSVSPQQYPQPVPQPSQEFSQQPGHSSQQFNQHTQSSPPYNQQSISSQIFSESVGQPSQVFNQATQPSQQYNSPTAQSSQFNQASTQSSQQFNASDSQSSQQINQTTVQSPQQFNQGATQSFDKPVNQNSQQYNQSNQPAQYNQPANQSNQPSQYNQQGNQSNQPSQYNQQANQSNQPSQYNQQANQSNQPSQYNQQVNQSNQPSQYNQQVNQSNQPSQYNQQANQSSQQFSPAAATPIYNQSSSQSYKQNLQQSQYSQNSHSTQQYNQSNQSQFTQKNLQTSQQQYSQQSYSQQPSQSPKQYTQQPAQSPQHFNQPVQSPQQFQQQPAPSPQQYNQHPAQSPQQFLQQPNASPQQFSQQPTPSPQQFSQQPTPSPQQFSQQPTPSPQQFSQPAPSPQQFSQPTPSPQQFSQPTASPQQFSQTAPSPQQFSQTAPSPQQFSQPAPSPQQFSQPTPSPQQFSQPTPSPQQFSQQNHSPQQYSQPAPSPQQFSQPAPSPQPFSQPAPSPQSFSQPSPSPQQFNQQSASSQQFNQQNPQAQYAQQTASQHFPQQPSQASSNQQYSHIPSQSQYKQQNMQTSQYTMPQQCMPGAQTQFPNSFSPHSNQSSTKNSFQTDYQSQPNASVSPQILPTQTVNQQVIKQTSRGCKNKQSRGKTLSQTLLPQTSIQSNLKQPPSFSVQAFQNGNPSNVHQRSVGQQSVKSLQESGNSLFNSMPNQESFTLQHIPQDSAGTYSKCPKAILQPVKHQNQDSSQLSQMNSDILQNENEHKNISSSNESAVVSFRDRIDSSINYEWAIPIMKDYVLGVLENSHKMMVLFVIIDETLQMGDKLLVFSQSLSTLDLLEQFLNKIHVPKKPDQPEQIVTETWSRNKNYFRLDGSTSAQEREKLINEFNRNDNVSLFLLSTRAGCLGINLVGANRIVVMDASWNPCHDAQAVCRIYRYGQKKQCYIYRLVTDNSLEKRIYDRQVNKQGMSDRVVDELNPESNFTWKDVTTLIQDDEDDGPVQELSKFASSYTDRVLQYLVSEMSPSLSKEPFEHESLLLDRKDLKLTKQEKRLAKQSYEMAKRANMINIRTTYTYLPAGTAGGGQFIINNKQCQWVGGTTIRVLPNQNNSGAANARSGTTATPITASPTLMSSLFKQGVMVQKLTMPSNVSIPVLTPGAPPVVIPAGQDVLVLRTPKGVYLRLPDGRIIAVQLPPSLLAKTQFRPNVVTHFRPAAPKGGNQSTTVINTPRGQSIGIIKQTLQCGGTVRYLGPRNAAGSSGHNSSRGSAPEVIDLSDDEEPRKHALMSNASANSSESESGSGELEKGEKLSTVFPGKHITIRKISNSVSSPTSKEKCEIPQVLSKNKQITILPVNPSAQQNRQKFPPQLSQPVRVQQMLLQPQQGKRKSIQKNTSKVQMSPLLSGKSVRSQLTITQPTSTHSSFQPQKVRHPLPLQHSKGFEFSEKGNEQSSMKSSIDSSSVKITEKSPKPMSTTLPLTLQNKNSSSESGKIEGSILPPSLAALAVNPNLQITPTSRCESSISDLLSQKPCFPAKSQVQVSATSYFQNENSQNIHSLKSSLQITPTSRSETDSLLLKTGQHSKSPIHTVSIPSSIQQQIEQQSNAAVSNKSLLQVSPSSDSTSVADILPHRTLCHSKSSVQNSSGLQSEQSHNVVQSLNPNLQITPLPRSEPSSISDLFSQPKSILQNSPLMDHNINLTSSAIKTSLMPNKTDNSLPQVSVSQTISNKSSISKPTNVSDSQTLSSSQIQVNQLQNPIQSSSFQQVLSPQTSNEVKQQNQQQSVSYSSESLPNTQMSFPSSVSSVSTSQSQHVSTSQNQHVTSRKRKSSNKQPSKKSHQQHLLMSQNHVLQSQTMESPQPFLHPQLPDHLLPENHFPTFPHHISGSDFTSFSNFSSHKATAHIQHPQPLHPLQHSQEHSLLPHLQHMSHLYPMPPHLAGTSSLPDTQPPAPRAWPVPQPSVSSFHPFSQSSPFFSSGQESSQFSFPSSFPLPPSTLTPSLTQSDSNANAASGSEKSSRISSSDM